jgi:hypothetical protein
MNVNTEYKIYWKIDFGLWSGDHNKPFSSDFVDELLSIESYFQSSFGIILREKRNCDWWSSYEGTWGLVFEMERPLLYGEFISSLSRETIDSIALELFKHVRIVKDGYAFWVYSQILVCDFFRKLFFESDRGSLILDSINIPLIEEKDSSFRLGLPCFYPYKFIDHYYVYENSPICGFLPNDTLKEKFSLFDLQQASYHGEFAHAFLTTKKKVLWSNIEFPKPIPKTLKFVMFLLNGRPRIIRHDHKPCNIENYAIFLLELFSQETGAIKSLKKESEIWQLLKEITA